MEESEYEKMRAQRIAQNQEFFKKLFPVSPLNEKRQSATGKIKVNSQQKLHRSPRRVSQYPTRRNPKRNCKRRKTTNYSSDQGSDCEDQERSSDFEPEEDNSEENDDWKPSGLVVKLWGKKTISNGYQERKRSPKKILVDKKEILERYDSLTEDDLVMVAETTSEKRYDQSGTTCHQCRQKTDDLKTVCRSDNCSGVKGQFCGPCLRNRYGEDAKLAIMDKAWTCPPCRGICNCSFCMPKRGRRATGILIHIAKGNGYTSVKDFLGD